MKNTLPALNVEVSGLTLKSNLPEFKIAATKYLDNINKLPTTDEDYAQAKKDVKDLKSFEDNLKQIKADMITKSAEFGEV
ncbi:MAG: hypothetical protein OEY89_18335, partial [Gammaproteobacteria bacterium]|nr:hypothetical protein [Gammaproteobacteria bacterium]